MARTFSHTIVSSKMDILLKHSDYLQTFVDETKTVLQLTTSWLSNVDTTQNFTFTEINKMIEDKLAYLGNANFSVGCEATATEQEPVATRSSPSAPRSTDQSLPAGHVHVSGVTVATDELKTIWSQVNVMQDAMSSLSTSSKMLSEKQLAMEKLVESLSDKYSKVEQEKLREIEGELEGIKEKHKKAAIQQDKRMTSFEKKIQAVTDTQSVIKENYHQQQIKIKDQKKETEKLKTQSQQFTKDLRDALENNAATNTQVGALEGKIESLKESLEELSTRFEEHGSSLEELTKRNEETLKVLTSAQESESEKLQKLEEKLSALENSWSETTVENGKLCQDVETKHEMVCQVVTDRLVPLERLRDIFNGNLDARTGNLKKLDNVCDQMADLLPKFKQVEQQTQRQDVGFSAEISTLGFLWKGKPFINNQNLISSKVTINVGDHYDPKTGKFTAPVDGLYAAYFSIATKESDRSSFQMRRKPCSCEYICSKCLCCVVLKPDGMTHASTFVLVEMKAGHKLFVKCFTTIESMNIKESTFFCFKIC